MRRVIGVTLALSLTGCGAVGVAVESLDANSFKAFEVKDVDTFRIADDSEASRIVIAASPMRMAGAALNNLFTFGVSYPDTPQPVMKSAVIGYLKSTNRDCDVTEEKQLSRMQWEFRYQCKST